MERDEREILTKGGKETVDADVTAINASSADVVDRANAGKRSYRVIYPIFMLLALLAGLLVATYYLTHQEPVRFRGGYGFPVGWDIDELIGASNAIVIAEVGEVKHRDYPGKLSREDYSDEEIRIIGGDKFLERFWIDYQEINVNETLKGEAPQKFLLARGESIFNYYGSSINSEYWVHELLPGERVILFIREGIVSPQYRMSVDEYYTAFNDFGILEYADNERVYPKWANPFFRLTELDGLVIEGDSHDYQSTYIGFDILQERIEKHPCSPDPLPCRDFPSLYNRPNDN